MKETPIALPSLRSPQPDLFSGDDLTFDDGFARANRIALDSTSWVEHYSGWLSGSQQLLEQLLTAAGWEQRSRWMVNRTVIEPRLTAEYNDLTEAPAPILRAMAAAFTQQFGVTYDGLWINLYRSHRDSTGWHGDWPTCKRAECTVPVLSLGATRRFLLKPRLGGRSIGLTVASGDLVVMGGRCQRDWRHCVPKQATPAGPRVSVNFSSREQAIPDPPTRSTTKRQGNRD